MLQQIKIDLSKVLAAVFPFEAAPGQSKTDIVVVLVCDLFRLTVLWCREGAKVGTDMRVNTNSYSKMDSGHLLKLGWTK